MTIQCVRLKVELQRRHWQTHRTFCSEYDKAAQLIDPELIGPWPQRAQFHRWLAGELKGLPYPHHCRVLEKMLPPWSAAQLFEWVTISQSNGFARDSFDSGNEQVLTQHSEDARGQFRLVTSGADLSLAMLDVVRGATECLVAVGSRSREPTYLREIEHALRSKPNMIHYRILIGLPHNQLFKDHLFQLIELRDANRRNGHRKTLYISISDDLTSDHERFFVASERAAVVVLPSANSPANFDTGLLVSDPAYTRSLVEHGMALYGRRQLETTASIEELTVLR